MLGGAVIALHFARGPRLGLPQMISSRAQFGVRCAIVPLAPVIVVNVGFSAGGSVLAGQAVGELLGPRLPSGSRAGPGLVAFALVTGPGAAVGCHLVHSLGRLASLEVTHAESQGTARSPSSTSASA